MRRNRKNMNMSKQINDEMLDNVVGGSGEVEVTQYESLNYHVLVEKEKGGYNSIWKEKKEGCSCSERHFLSYCSWIA